jgi:hypothetical protein
MTYNELALMALGSTVALFLSALVPLLAASVFAWAVAKWYNWLKETWWIAAWSVWKFGRGLWHPKDDPKKYLELAIRADEARRIKETIQ